MASAQTINTIVWTFSFALQALLVVSIFRRGLARRLPSFAVLIVFYPVRSALLFVLFGHIPADDYGSFYSTLSLVDLVLQGGFIIEITVRLLRRSSEFNLRRHLLVLVPLVAAAASGVVNLALLPHHAPIPVDRIQTFISYLLIGLFISTILTTTSPLLRITTLGFALYSSISLVAQTERLSAALHRNAAAYTAWSYTIAAAYLLAVFLWVFALKPENSAKAFRTVDPEPREVTP
ncbi:MAG TPA: hypothetical protein VNU92_06225 [Edaphobacter sp.]|jgi:hypothetical protein|nr:hypothetical protein [Edaphobacter sp.]